MPNWVSNTLVLEHDDPAMLERARKALDESNFLEEFIPIPAELKNTTAPNKEPNRQELIDKYGAGDWYDWCCSNWGTKWDLDSTVNDIDEKTVVAYFDSAWSPPIAAYGRLEEMGFRIFSKYYEGGCGFAGIYDEYGDEYYDLTGQTADEVASTIPGHLDEEFGISESMRELEEPEPLTEWYKQGLKDTGLENE